MNTLETWLKRHPWVDPVDAMDQLQDAGIVADEAVEAADVAKADCAKATAFLDGD